ncbi:MAG: 16S rRNA (adenine(1518)-N(6)/adenine(1519)-N(6))-dimethyltransferase RsmA [Thermodesulfobacteriota bacterium]|nr:16S rRNA (adenine(1518)-N(6)/adenine(1519)-N(6))-dimethyltransferase RsmA [Thermodesulfobacteriota bacterium]
MASPKALLRTYGINPKKTLGQNFLCDRQASEMIIRRCGITAGDTVVEIGAGTGALTVPAARAAIRVHAIETDGRLIKLLEQMVNDNQLSNVAIHHKDIMDVDFPAMAGAAGGKLIVIGNLPYYLSSQILIRLVEHREVISRAVLMFQQELARRVAAATGSREYGRLSVIMGYCSEVTTVARLKPDLFYPRPGVHSEVIEIKFKNTPATGGCDEALLFDIIRHAFGKRRKTLKNALTSGIPGPGIETWMDILARAEIDPGARAETLMASDFVNICNYYESIYATTKERHSNG